MWSESGVDLVQTIQSQTQQPTNETTKEEQENANIKKFIVTARCRCRAVKPVPTGGRSAQGHRRAGREFREGKREVVLQLGCRQAEQSPRRSSVLCDVVELLRRKPGAGHRGA